MTISDNLELEPQQPLVNEEQEATRKKKPYKSTRYKRGGGVTNYRSTNYPTRYYNEALSAYPLNYMYYPSMSFPVIFDHNSNTQNDEDLEIIMHDESSLNTPTEPMVPITKPIESKRVVFYQHLVLTPFCR